MNAQQAREFHNSLKPSHSELKELYESIKLHIRAWPSSNNINVSVGKLSEVAVKHLKEVDGYGVERISDSRDGDFYKITW